jgi:hypothetical protein
MKWLQLDLKLHIGAMALWYTMKQETGNHQKRKWKYNQNESETESETKSS